MYKEFSANNSTLTVRVDTNKRTRFGEAKDIVSISKDGDQISISISDIDELNNMLNHVKSEFYSNQSD